MPEVLHKLLHLLHLQVMRRLRLHLLPETSPLLRLLALEQAHDGVRNAGDGVFTANEERLPYWEQSVCLFTYGYRTVWRFEQLGLGGSVLERMGTVGQMFFTNNSCLPTRFLRQLDK